MKIEKREGKPSKTYRSTNRLFGSKDDIISELHSLLTRLQNRIDEHSTKMRKMENQQGTANINQMNQFKLHRNNMQFIKESLQAYEDDSWREMLPEIVRAFNKAEQLAVIES